MRRILGLLYCMCTLSVAADPLTIERIFADPALAGPTPRGVKIAPDGSRVGLLRGRADDQHQLDLWTYDLKTRTLHLAVDSRKLLPNEQLSDVEKGRRERARIADFHGIVDYVWAPDGQRVLFTLGDTLYLYNLDAPAATALTTLIQSAEPLLDAQVSPKGQYVSYVRNQNLWVIELASGKRTQLTHDGGGAVHNAEAEFVAQEEMDQRSGYWWAPDDAVIAYKRFDESAVPLVKRMELHADHVDVVEQRYPAAGDPNVTVSLGLVAPTGGESRFIDLGADPDIYLARADWTPDSHHLAFQRLTRSQKRVDLMLVDRTSLTSRTVLTETSAAWINLHDDLRFLTKQSAFIWASERSGMKHLYLYGLDGTLLRPLSVGDWNIDTLLAVDEHSGLVYFDANKDAAYDRQIYTVRLDGTTATHPQRISLQDGWHDAQFAHGANRVGLYVDTYSNPTTPPQVAIHAPNGQHLAWIEENALNSTHPYWPYREQHLTPEYGHITADDGQRLEYQLIKPLGFDPSRKYPVFLRVYGGPTSQQVHRGWQSAFDIYMAQHGYLVFMLDNRGTPRRGRKFSDAIAGQLGAIEVKDQLAGVRWLGSQAFVDAKHIGVFGWSYGGYMTLMLLSKGSDLIAGGAAVAPVTDWRLYDTCYTERYLERPLVNPKGYEQSAVFAALDGLHSPLFLAHGMADDNVLFANSTSLMSELQKRNVQFELMTYPGAKHGLSTPQMKTHIYTAIKNFMDARLKPAAH